MLFPSVIILLCLQMVIAVAGPNQLEDQYYIGCFKDSYTRNLPKYVGSLISVFDCIKKCRKEGYPYAGAQNGNECYCGFKYDRSPRTTNCYKKCSNKVDVCGGPWANSIYGTVAPPKDEDQYYLGCYTDGYIGKLPTSFRYVVSVKECVEECRKAGYAYAALQQSIFCYCRKNYQVNAQVTNCDMMCENGIEICGGSWVNSIYSTDKKFDSPSQLTDQYYIGCFKDDKSRKLPKYMGSLSSVMDCIKKCAASGYEYAGAQNGKWCFCGSQYDLSTRSTNCNKKCPNKVDVCGGLWANSIYGTVAPNKDEDQYYLGCYRDRLYKKLPNMGPIRSVKECVKRCRNAGYAYAGVQLKTYCFCDNEYKLSARVTNCDMMCENGIEICGGKFANSIYSTDKKFDTNPNQLDDQYYIGCFKDDKSRKLPKYVGATSSVLDCIEKCRTAGYPYAGAQNGTECFCGFQYDLSPRVTNCYKKCSNNMDVCGGPWANSIYGTVAPNEDEDQYYLGCYKDEPVRKLPKSVGYIASVKECVNVCRKAGYAYAGVQYSTYCFCGNEYNISAQVNNCDMMCKNGIEICGGGFANSIYSTDKKFDTGPNQLADQYYIGCFKDDKSRKLPKFMGSLSSVMECIKKCAASGYQYAGAQNGNLCFCGSQYDLSPQSTNCNKKCLNKVDICGGNWANSIYSTVAPNKDEDQYYLGCYRDGPVRKLPKFMEQIDSVKECVKACRNASYAYAGVQYSTYCFCGNKYNVSAQVTNCDMMCENGIEICGGGFANSIYSTDKTFDR